MCYGTGCGSVGLRCCPVTAPLSRLGGRQRRRLGAAAGGHSVLASVPAPAGARPGNAGQGDRRGTVRRAGGGSLEEESGDLVGRESPRARPDASLLGGCVALALGWVPAPASLVVREGRFCVILWPFFTLRG